MKKLIVCCLLLSVFFAKAQSDTGVYAKAKTFMQKSDFANAIPLLKQVLQSDPNNKDIVKDLSLSYYFINQNEKALELLLPLIDKEDADDQCYQITGSIYLRLNNVKECERIYKKGIKQFPESGPLYNEYGEFLYGQQNFVMAIQQWEKGIEKDPDYSKNYYSAARYYYYSSDKIWSIIYGEIFLNIEPSGARVIEIKELLLGAYKKFYADIQTLGSLTKTNAFEGAVISILKRQQDFVGTEMNPETLIMLRTRFILDWNKKYAAKFPFKLFDHQTDLLREGMYEAYNQWIFGSIQNLMAYQSWTRNNDEAYQAFSQLQKSRIFKLPQGQYYQSR